MLNKEDQSNTENPKQQSSHMLQTAQFFNTLPKPLINHSGQDTLEECDKELEFNEFIDIPQQAQDKKADTKDRTKCKKVNQPTQKKKKSLPVNNHKELTSSKKCLTQHDSSLIAQQNYDLKDEKVFNSLYSKETSVPKQSNSNAQQNCNTLLKQKNMHQSQKVYNLSNERVPHTKEASIVSEVKKRGLSLAQENEVNEDTDIIFWNKINQIVCVNNDSKVMSLNALTNNNSMGQFQSFSAVPSHRQIYIPSNCHKTEKSSTLTHKNYSERSEACIQDLIQQQQFSQSSSNYITNKSPQQKDSHMNLSQPKQQFMSPYHSMKNFNLHGSLPLLNGHTHQQKQEYQQQQKKVFYVNNSQEMNRKQSQLGCIERNFWSSQMGMRQDIQNPNIFYNTNQVNSNHQLLPNHLQHHISTNESRENMQIALSTSPQQRLSNQQYSQMTIHPNYQSCKNILQNNNSVTSSNQSQLHIRNQNQNAKFPNENLAKKSNNYMNEGPSLLANREAQLNYLTQQQMEGIDNYYQDPYNNNHKLSKTAFSSPSTASSSVKDSALPSQLQFSEYVCNEKEVRKQKLVNVNERKVQGDKSDVNQMKQLQKRESSNNYVAETSNDQKEKQPNFNKPKAYFNQSSSNNNPPKATEFTRKVDESVKENQVFQVGGEQKSSIQKELHPVKAPKRGGNQQLRNSIQLNQFNDMRFSEDFKNILSAQSAKTVLRESSQSGENRINITGNNQSTQLQKNRIKSCQQSQYQSQQQEFSFCLDRNQFAKNEEKEIDLDDRNILGQIQNLNTNNKEYYSTEENTLKRWNQFDSLSQTTKNNNKFNLKCKQQQNVVKKIFNFDAYQTSTTTTTSTNTATTTAASDAIRSRRQSNTSQGCNFLYNNGSNFNYSTQHMLDQQQLQLQKQLMYYTEQGKKS